MVLAGVAGESGNLNGHLQSAADKIQSALKDLGVSSNSAEHATDDAGSGLTRHFMRC